MSVATARAHPRYGTELVRTWTPSGDPAADIILVHGIAEHSGRYERVGEILAGLGFRVTGFDLAGHGMTGGRRAHIDDWDEYLDQIESHVIEASHPRVLLGHSMGGNLVLGYAASHRAPVDLVVASAPALTGGAAWQRAIAPFVARILPKLPAPQKIKGSQLSRDPLVGEKYFADPLVVTSATTRLGAELFSAMDRVADSASDITVPVLVLHGEDDTIVPAQSTEPLGSLAGFERRTYPGLRHEIFNEPEGPDIVAEVADWIRARL